jgi:hypothetical protein
MLDSVSPAESEPISVVSSGWLWAARCSALICTITLGVGFVAEAAADQNALLIFFGPWGSLSLALLYLLFRKGKNSLAFALGLGAATAFITLFGVASVELSRSGFPLEVFRHVLLMAAFSGILPPFANLMNGLHPQLATLGVVLLWLFSISLAMLGLSSIVAFRKMARGAIGTGKLRLAFRAGICCPLVVWPIFMLLGLYFFGGFHI